jgi:hypothetical protein
MMTRALILFHAWLRTLGKTTELDRGMHVSYDPNATQNGEHSVWP